MKNSLIWVLVLLASGQVMAQKKGKIDPRDVALDSLSIVLQTLEGELESMNASLDEANQELAYYTTARELVENNIVKYPIEPAAMSMILDTALTNRDQAIQTLAAQVKSLQDDVLILQADNNRLQQALESMAQANADPEKLVKELRQLKSLLDSEIITQEEFDIKKAKLLAKWE